MAFQLVWNKRDIKKTDAVVTVRRQAFFGPRAGAVRVSGHEPCRIQVVSPNWKMDSEQLLEMLPRCYREILRRAVAGNCGSVSLPLLSAQEPGFPRYWDYTVAFETIRDFTAEHDIDVYLVLDRMDPPDDGKIRADLDRFLEKPVRDTDKSAGWHEPPPRPKPADETRWASGTGEFVLPPFPELPDSGKENGWDMPAPEPPASAKCIGHPSGRTFARPAPMGMPAVPPVPVPTADELTEFLKNADAGFTESLLKCIDATGKKDSEIYTKANVSRQLFSKIRNDLNYRPTKQTAVAFAIALELDFDQTQDLIGRAGYTLNKNNTFDMIITFFIERRCYNLIDINIALLKFDQKLLGA